jgi:serine/threonine-protein phosphatase 6 regulatory ankyrin repeat subunit B
MTSRGRITIPLTVACFLLMVSGCESPTARYRPSKNHKDFQRAMDENDYDAMSLLLAKNHNLLKQVYRPRAGSTFPGMDRSIAYHDVPLCLAAFYGDAEMAKLFITHGAAVYHRDHCPLYIAACQGHADVARVLISEKADVNRKHKARSSETALHAAAAGGHKDVVEILIAEGATVNAKDDKESTPTYYASVSGHEDVVAMLRQHGGTLGAEIYDAVDLGDLEKVRSLLNERPKLIATKEFAWKWTPLFWAVKNGNTDIAAYLVSAGADVHAENTKGLTLLQVAYTRNHKDMVDLLRKGGAALDIEIHEAAEQGDLTEVKHILGKDPTAVRATDALKWTPLFWAVEGKHPELIELLVKWEANTNAKDNYGRTPLLRAAQRGDDEIVKLLIDEGANVNMKDKWGLSPLHRAVEKGHRKTAEVLIGAGADVDIRDRWSCTPLYRAALAGNTDLLESLLAHGASLNSVGRAGAAALHGASAMGHVNAVGVLIANKADVNATDDKGRTPLDWATYYKREDVAELLREHGATERMPAGED